MKALAVLLAVHVAIFAAQVDIARGTLTLEDRQTGAVAGTFRSWEGDGIRFRSTPDSLEITTLDGADILKLYKPSAAKSRTMSEVKPAVVYQFLEDVYAESNERMYRFSASDFDIGAAITQGIDLVSHLRLLANLQLQAKPLNDPITALQASIDQLVVHPATRLLEPAARALGEDTGIIGRDEPAAMPFYLAAMTLTEKYKRNQRAKAKKNNPLSTYLNRPKRGRYPDCDLESCPPCKEDDCYGLCGYGCTCWSFLCGDCCYHLGCKDHDACCRESDGSYLGCFFPFGFSCDDRYEC